MGILWGVICGEEAGYLYSQRHEQAMLELTMTLIIAIQLNLGG